MFIGECCPLSEVNKKKIDKSKLSAWPIIFRLTRNAVRNTVLVCSMAWT